MPKYGSFNDPCGSDTSIGTRMKTKKPRHTHNKPRIPTISLGISYDINTQPTTVNTFGSVMNDVTSEVDLNTTSETDAEGKPRYQPHILEKSFEKTVCYHLKRRKKASKLVISFLCIFTIVFHATFLVVSIIYTSSMKTVGGDEFVVLLSLAAVVPVPVVLLSLLLKFTYDKTITLKPASSFVLYGVLGFCLCLHLNMGLFASHPHKTPEALQPGLSAVVVPFTVIVSLIIIRKGFSKRRVVCCAVALVAVFISAEPRIWPVEGSGTGIVFYSSDIVKQVVWPLIFCLSYLPLAVYNVLAQREVRKPGIHVFSLSTSGILSACVFSVLAFGTDFLPWYGNVSNFSEFWVTFKTGFRCNFSYAPDCQQCPVKLIVLGASVTLFNIFSLLLIYTTDDSVFASLIMCLSAPVASAFWTLFDYNYTTDSIGWRSGWSHTTAFLIVSILILVPTAVVYNHFTVKDAKDSKREKNGYSDVSSSEYEWD